jgi:parvulin-like peptidyl-prolyl isomerase
MERQTAQALLGEALAELKQSRSFEELARLTAEGTKGIQGSELGLFRADELTPQLREVVRGLKSGQVSPIVESDFGYQVVYVQRIQETAAKPLDRSGGIQDFSAKPSTTGLTLADRPEALAC